MRAFRKWFYLRKRVDMKEVMTVSICASGIKWLKEFILSITCLAYQSPIIILLELWTVWVIPLIRLNIEPFDRKRVKDFPRYQMKAN
jgi:hypothetical protein